MLKHKGTMNIETTRLILRKITFNDIYFINNWHKNKDVSKYMAWEKCENLFETCQVVNAWLNNYEKNNTYLWGIQLKENNKLIGRIKLTNVNDDTLSCEADYCISSEFWGKGYASESLNAVIEFAFNKVEFNRVYACHVVENKASEKVMQKCKMQYEGTLRDRLKNADGFHDCKIYSILKNDFFKSEKA